VTEPTHTLRAIAWPVSISYLLHMNRKPLCDASGRPLDMDTLLAPLQELYDCACCPRECHVDRFTGPAGYCHSDAGFAISSICAHKGEEPVISGDRGICNIFFSQCNMQCVYCQNYQISHHHCRVPGQLTNLTQIITRIEQTLDQGAHAVGFVSPSHCIPHVRVIIAVLKARGRTPVFVFNTGGYDKPETIRSFEKTIDVWLPDLKYLDNSLASRFSDAPNYVDTACAAVKEMYRQTGPDITLDQRERILAGLVIRHLVLPGHVENSTNVLRWIAQQLSPDVHVSLMSQYFPTFHVSGHPQLGRTLTTAEYEAVLEEFDRLGFHRGWIQELDSPLHYRPDFDRDHPFEGNES